ncbi:MAG: RdgB/HAM1 family non-canonical purine NTP pyrophosphatase [Lentisphaerae bacterium]|jgi:non-canonical purine NTP pyrophosphatase (RdgB/HAM1 family)|nr:RdgB/HAM1 family non-canonical purine NTP pyrophosphatase [Lentisphaerota bacterium]
MKTIAIATGNKHKVEEITAILKPLGYTVISADELGGLPDDIAENADTFRENALIKARACAKHWNKTVLADDSGLVVDALGGLPGAHSARYAGEGGNDGRNLDKLLRNMEGVENRTARFVTVIAIVTPDGKESTAEGTVEGRIIHEKRGTGGFGYDPSFVPDGETLTFAELPAEAKNSMSHRANALKNAVKLGLL